MNWSPVSTSGLRATASCRGGEVPSGILSAGSSGSGASSRRAGGNGSDGEHDPVQKADDLPVQVFDPARLAAVYATGLLDIGPETVFDDLAHLAVSVTGAPMAFITVPPGGQVLGTICAVDTAPRTWSEQESRTLSTLARAIIGEIALRQAVRQMSAQMDDLRATSLQSQALARSLQDSLLPPRSWPSSTAPCSPCASPPRPRTDPSLAPVTVSAAIPWRRV